MEGIDGSFAAAFYIGYNARRGPRPFRARWWR